MDGTHPVIGNVHRLSPWQIGVMLEEQPPDRWAARMIAQEEAKRPGGDRPEIYRLLSKYVSPLTVAASLLSEDDAA